MQNIKGMYLCCLGHPSDLQSVRSDSLNVDVDAEESSSYLQESAKCQKSKRLTRSAPEGRSHTEMPHSVDTESMGPGVDAVG